MTNFITRYNYKPAKGIVNNEESKTYQECKDDCDINVLYRRFLVKGLTPPNVKSLEARYADISEARNYEDLLNIQEDVKGMFGSLPSEIRSACDYNVDTFMELISSNFDDPELQKLQSATLDKLGMVERKQELQKPTPEPLPKPDPVDPSPASDTGDKSKN
ncbi:MAG: hypothetical protein LBK53_07145 [Heliobacteriaceae bacterium]|jgi:hypothetical protein|nr:hypothetical protein [Heliobacteriaceae bacterium]